MFKPGLTTSSTVIGAAHVERYRGELGDRPTLVSCDCPIGHDHDYRDWEKEFVRDFELVDSVR